VKRISNNRLELASYFSPVTLHRTEMTPEQWQKVEAVLQQALDCPPRDRASYLDAACAGDEQLIQEATSLINAFEEAGDFIEQPAIAQDAGVLVGAPVTEKVGQEVGPYKIVKRLGVGGMGEVYLAQDTRLDRLVALKILPAYFASDDARLRRFQREARAASALNHPNILTIHEVGESTTIKYIATEFIDGVTIRQLLNQRELSLQDILDIAGQVCSGLAAAHAAGIVHRDIKPENIMRRADGLVKILDFGIAKLLEADATHDDDQTQPDVRTRTEAGIVVGTVNYMSPEQARGLAVDERTDLWSLGVVLYEMLAQRLPFKGDTRMDTLVAILDRDPPTLCSDATVYCVSPLLDQTISKCLRKTMADRFASANDLLIALKRVKQGDDGFALDDDSFEPAAEASLGVSQFAGRSFSRRYAWPTLSLAVVLIVATAGLVLYRRSAATTADAVKQPSVVAAGKLYSQMNETERLTFVDEQEQRISTMMGDRPVKLDQDTVAVIKAYVDRYAARGVSSELQSESISVVYGRARAYVPLIARSFAARKVPIIIGIYLPMIESAYRNCYENSIGAKGLFQFLPQTAERYGVARQDMCDVEKMTPAAAHYIADGMAELGEDSESMTLVLLSYNRGAESVRNNLRQLRGSENYERNFWTLFAHRNELDKTFQNEGAHYVPSFFAAAIIGENPQTFGLPMAPLSTLAAQH
jgi:serine/threonine protein kinase